MRVKFLVRSNLVNTRMVVLYKHLTTGYPCLGYFPISSGYPGSVGQFCPELGEVVCDVDFGQ